MKHIKRGELRDYLVALPASMDEQTAIFSKLDECDRCLAVNEEELAVHMDLKTGLMDDLLTGKVQVTAFVE